MKWKWLLIILVALLTGCGQAPCQVGDSFISTLDGGMTNARTGETLTIEQWAEVCQ